MALSVKLVLGAIELWASAGGRNTSGREQRKRKEQEDGKRQGSQGGSEGKERNIIVEQQGSIAD